MPAAPLKKLGGEDITPDLQPDLVGALNYFDNGNSAQPTAFARPGAFALDSSPTVALPFPAGNKTCGVVTPATDRYVTTCTNERGRAAGNHIVVVFHTAPLDDEVTPIYDMVEELVLNQDKLISVIYFPTGARDASEAGIENLLNAFTGAVPPAPSPLGARAPSIYVFSPFNYPANTVAEGRDASAFSFGGGQGILPAEQFARYWRYLLDFENNPQDNVIAQAKKFFMMRVLGRRAHA